MNVATASVLSAARRRRAGDVVDVVVVGRASALLAFGRVVETSPGAPISSISLPSSSRDDERAIERRLWEGGSRALERAASEAAASEAGYLRVRVSRTFVGECEEWTTKW